MISENANHKHEVVKNERITRRVTKPFISNASKSLNPKQSFFILPWEKNVILDKIVCVSAQAKSFRLIRTPIFFQQRWVNTKADRVPYSY